MQFHNKIFNFIAKNLDWAALSVLPFIVFSFQYDLANPFVSSKELTLRILSLGLIFILAVAMLFKSEFGFLRFSKRLKFFVAAFLINLGVVFTFSVNKIPFLFGTFQRGMGLLDFILIIALAFIFIVNYKSSRVEYYAGLIVSTSICLGVYGILQTIGYDPFFSHVRIDIFEGRAFSFLGNPSYLGQFLAMSIPFVFLLRIRKEFKLVLLIILLASVFASQTRSAVLALIAVSCLLVLVHLVKSFSRKSLLVLICIVGVIIGLLFTSRFAPTDVNLRSLESRFTLWGYTYDLILENPIGYGLNSFYIYFPTKVDKEFFKLEESLNTYADRVHNEFLSLAFSYGVFAGLLYLFFVGFLIYRIWNVKDEMQKILICVLLISIIQNQFGFHDLSSIILFGLTLIILFYESSYLSIERFDLKNHQYLFIVFLLPAIILLSKSEIINYKNFHNTILHYTAAKQSSYESTVNVLKSAIDYYPIYSKYWYSLMSIDPSSGPRALRSIQNIEPASTDLIAWKGNMYATQDPEYAKNFFKEAIQKAPYNPHFIRAYGDFLYKQKTNPALSLELYKKYLLLVPDYYTWKDKLNTLTPEQQKSYRIFFKNVPDFWNVFDRIKILQDSLKTQHGL